MVTPKAENIFILFACVKVLVVILGSSSSDDVRMPSEQIKKSGVRTISVGTDSSVPTSLLEIIAIGRDAVITTTTITKIDSIRQTVIDRINDSKYCLIVRQHNTTTNREGMVFKTSFTILKIITKLKRTNAKLRCLDLRNRSSVQVSQFKCFATDCGGINPKYRWQKNLSYLILMSLANQE